jgi:hypothetical protein
VSPLWVWPLDGLFSGWSIEAAGLACGGETGIAAPHDLQVELAICVKPHFGHRILVVGIFLPPTLVFSLNQLYPLADPVISRISWNNAGTAFRFSTGYDHYECETRPSLRDTATTLAARAFDRVAIFLILRFLILNSQFLILMGF